MDPQLVLLTLGVVVVGFGSGVLSGMFGVGGAVLTTPGIRALGATPLAAIGSTVPPIIPGAISGAYRYAKAGLVDWRVGVACGIAGAVAAVAGALYVPQVGIINPSEMSPANSIEIAIWTAVGGRGTLVGPVVGAAVVNLGKSWFTQALPEYWLYVLGLLFILVTLYLPRGIAGLWTRRPS